MNHKKSHALDDKYSQQPRDETQPGNETVADFVQFLTDFFDFFYP